MAALRRFFSDLAQDLAIFSLEMIFFQPIAPLRWVLRRFWAKNLAELGPHFDAGLYLRQVSAGRRRRQAGRDPLVHYALIGWREYRSPNRRFDPRFWREDVWCGRAAGEPLRHSLDHATAATAQNEVEAAAPDMPAAEGSPTALIFHHARGGGSSQYLAIFEASLRREGLEPIRLRLVPRSDRLVIWDGGAESHAVFDIITDADALAEAARRAGVARLVVSHVIDFDPAIITLVHGLAKTLAIPFWMILHDYFCLCPRVNLIDSKGRPCPIPSPAACVPCVADGGGDVRRGDAALWRPTMLAFIEQAARVLVPSHDARMRLQPFLGVPVEAWLPESDVARPPLRAPRAPSEAPLRIVALGSLNVAKGSEVLFELGRLIQAAGAPLHLAVVGEAANTKNLESVGVTVSGRYRMSDIRSLLDAAGTDVVFLPAICPETWSFVLSVALDMGLPVVAFAHGAPFERLAALGRSDLILPLDMIEDPEAVMAFFLGLRRMWQAVPAPAERQQAPVHA